MVSEKKIKEFNRIKELLNKYKNYIIIDLYLTPSMIYKKIQDELKKVNSVLTCVKKRIFLKCVEGDKKFEKIKNRLPNMLGIIFTNEDTLKIYDIINKIKVYRFAKEGDVSPKDIWIRAGLTNLNPGPIISELSKVGLKVGVDKGKIAVKEDFLIVKKGEKISADKASVLQKFEIKPVEIKLNVFSVLLDSYWIEKDELSLYTEINNYINYCYSNAFNLSLNINYPTNKNINYLLQKAFLNNLSISNLLPK
ncbi:MAG: 50S ribosomal protein L10 [Candidatus Aenigmarchaeota archaeon]|nr:50S ribosomal protein L10 [Candidatus Aenigmarchaeota archaeon]MDW8149328.1 50S ribosomal protein L10 [Candidatus Aenigmarchaeota archaeon]